MITALPRNPLLSLATLRLGATAANSRTLHVAAAWLTATISFAPHTCKGSEPRRSDMFAKVQLEPGALCLPFTPPIAPLPAGPSLQS